MPKPSRFEPFWKWLAGIATWVSATITGANPPQLPSIPTPPSRVVPSQPSQQQMLQIERSIYHEMAAGGVEYLLSKGAELSKLILAQIEKLPPWDDERYQLLKRLLDKWAELAEELADEKKRREKRLQELAAGHLIDMQKALILPPSPRRGPPYSGHYND